MKIETVYKCPACGETYSTKQQAQKCYRSAEDTGIKVGDLVLRNGRCWKVLDISAGLVALDRVNDFVKLKGWDIHRDWQERAISVYNKNCGGKELKPLTTEEVGKELARRRMQVACGERLLEVLKCRSGESSTTPARTTLSVPLKRQYLKSRQKPRKTPEKKGGTKSMKHTKS